MRGNAIAVDSSGKAYIAGETSDGATDYPTTSGAYDESQNGGIDAFVTKLNASGSALEYSTFLGGSSTDIAYAIAVDSSGKAYVTGSTANGVTDFPTTSGAYDEIHNGVTDVFVAKLNATGTDLEYSTLIGGSLSDDAYAIAIDSSGKAYITGETTDSASSDYPTTAGAYDESHNGISDVFVTKLNADGSDLDYSTFLGGSNIDIGYGIAVDSSGKAYVTGSTTDATTDFPTTSGAYDETHNGSLDVFITKLNATGTALEYSTFLGGSGSESGRGIALDAYNGAYVTGFTSSSNLPVYQAYQKTNAGGDDVFIACFSADGASLLYSIYHGGSGGDYSYALAIDSDAAAYITGSTADHTTDLPTTSGAYDTSHNGSSDAYVSKFDFFWSAVRLRSFTATRRGERVLIRWRTAAELDNLGFHVYRSSGGELIRLTRELVAGSALVARGRALQRGHSYRWWDEISPEMEPVSYWLEDVDINGESTWHGPVAVQRSARPMPLAGPQSARAGSSDVRAETKAEADSPESHQAPQAAPVRGDPAMYPLQWILAGRPAVKVLIREEGWYRIEQQHLLEAGMRPMADPRRLRCFADGREVPLYIEGERDGRLDFGDAIEFYGLGVDTPYTDTRAYWLVEGLKPGRRITDSSPGTSQGRIRGPLLPSRKGRPSRQGRAQRSTKAVGSESARRQNPAPPSFSFTVERKERSIFFAALLNGDEENFFGPLLRI